MGQAAGWGRPSAAEIGVGDNRLRSCTGHGGLLGWLGFWLCIRRCSGGATDPRLSRLLGHPLTQWVGGAGFGRGFFNRGDLGHALGDQGFQRIRGFSGVEVQHQSVLVLGLSGFDRRQLKHLGLHHGAQIEHQSHRGRGELAHPNAGDVGVVRAHLADQLAQGGVELNALDVHRQARRVGHKLCLGGQSVVGLNGHPRVVFGRPHTHRQNSRAVRQLVQAQAQHQAAGFEQMAALHANKASPQALCARHCTSRELSPVHCNCITTSGAGSAGPAFCGHSHSLSPGAAKTSRKPASSHSSGSVKR